MDDDEAVYALDIGSWMARVGKAGDDVPQSVVPTAVASSPDSGYVCGEKLVEAREALSAQMPVHRGVVTDWEQFERFLAYVLNEELKVASIENSQFLFSEPLMNPVKNFQGIEQLMFETFGAVGIQFCSPTTATMYSSGRVTGMACVAGDGIVQLAPYWEGHVTDCAVRRIDFGGSDMTTELIRRLAAAGAQLDPGRWSDRRQIEEIKREALYVAEDYEGALEESPHGSMTVSIAASRSEPHGAAQSTAGDTEFGFVRPMETAESDFGVAAAKQGTNCELEIDKERFQIPEMLFSPPGGLPGLTQLLYSSLMDCDIDQRSDLRSNIVIAGGLASLNGLHARLKNDLDSLLPLRPRGGSTIVEKDEYCANTDRVWTGMSILSSLSTFGSFWRSRGEYDEEGPMRRLLMENFVRLHH